MGNKLIALYLSLGPIIWFSSFVLGPIKRILLLIIIISFFIFRPKGFRVKHLLFFLALVLSITVTVLMQTKGFSDDLINFYLAIIESYLFFEIGSNSNVIDSLEKNKSYINILFFFPAIASLLTLTNFIFGFPNWLAPGQLAKYEELNRFGYEIQELWATGFSWGRNGWGCTLAVLLPFCFFMKNKRVQYVVWGIVVASIVLCGNRNGLLAATITFAIYFYYTRKYDEKGNPAIAIILIVIFLLVVFGADFLRGNLRFNNSDISAGRFDQYRRIPDMFTEMGFWGMGYDGTVDYMYAHGLGYHAIHNAYFKIIFEFGIITSLFLFAIVYKAIKTVIKAMHSTEMSNIILSLVLVSGLILALFEPAVLFDSLGGYACWWCAFGYLSNVKFKQIKNEQAFS